MHRLKIILWMFICSSCNCSRSTHENPHVKIYTTLGDIKVELFAAKAPKTVAAFLSYIDKGIYTNSSFYRVLKAEDFPASFNPGIIQGGIWPDTNIKGFTIPGIPHESTKQTGLSHTNGTISLARTAPGTASTEFFICINDQTQFDSGATATGDKQGFAAFGRVYVGMEIVKKIQEQQSQGEYFTKKIAIVKIKKL